MPGILAVRLDTEARHEVADRADDALGLFVLDETAVGGDDAVRSGRVHAAEDLAARLLGALAVAAAARVAPLPRPSVRGALQLAAGRVGGHHLVAIVVRLVHAQDGRNADASATSANSSATRVSLLASCCAYGTPTCWQAPHSRSTGQTGAFCVERCAGWALPDEELGIVDAPMYVANKPLQLFAVAQLGRA